MNTGYIWCAKLVPILLIALLISCACSTEAETNIPPSSEGHGTPIGSLSDSPHNKTNGLPQSAIESALQAALSVLERKVSIGQQGSLIVIRWVKDGEWLIDFQNYSDMPSGHIQFLIRTNQVMAVTNGKTGGSEADWLRSARANTRSNVIGMPVQLALKKGLKSGAPVDTSILCDPRGRIKLSRMSDGSGWFMTMSGYRRLHLGGTSIEIRDDGTVETMGGL